MKLERIVGLLLGVSAVFIMTGCLGQQTVTWKTCGDIDYNKGAVVDVTSDCTVPDQELNFMKNDIQKKVDAVMQGDKNDPSAYHVDVNITTYDEGSAFGRAMLIGMGQMHLYGDVTVSQNDPPVVVRQGAFEKVFCLGGIAGAAASMHNNMVAKLGNDISNAIKAKCKTTTASESP